MPSENISKTEKILSISLGGRLLMFGTENIKKKPFPSIVKILLGSFLLYRGYSGYCPANNALGLNTAGQSLDEAIDTYTDTTPKSSNTNTVSNIPENVTY